MRNVDFRRGSNDEGRIIVDLTDANSGIDIRNLGERLVVDFFNATIPRSQERRLDVIDFGTPVQTIETFTQGGNVRISIESKGLWEYSAYQADRQFIIDIKKVQGDPNKKPEQRDTEKNTLLQPLKIEAPKASGNTLEPRFDIAVSNAPVAQVLMGIVSGTRYSMLMPPNLSGTVSVNLKDVTVFEALDAIREIVGYEYKVDGTRINVQPLRSP